MTSWRTPDYQINLHISIEEQPYLLEVSGNAFSIQLIRSNKKRTINGMIIIPKIETFTNTFINIWACLWINSKRAIVPTEESVKIKLIEECDPMHQFGNKREQLKKLLPLKLNGVIKKAEKTPIKNIQIKHILSEKAE